MPLSIRRASTTEFLKCPVCLEPFDSPKGLQCLHSYCSACLENLDKAEVGGQAAILCPFCKIATPVSSIESSATIEILATPTSPVQPKVHTFNLCDPCGTEQITKTADKFCTGCNEYLCDECNDFHKKFRATKNHVVLSISEMPVEAKIAASVSRPILCDCDDKRDVEFFCHAHEVICCGVCAVENHKPCPNVQPTSEMAESLKTGDGIDQIVRMLEKSRTLLKCILALAETNSRKLRDQVAGISSALKFLRRDINKLLDSLEMDLCAKGDEFVKQQETRNSEQVSRCSKYLAAIDTSRKLLRASVEHGSDPHLIDTYKKVDQHNKTYDHLVNAELSRRRNVGLELVLDDDINNLASKTSIGTIHEREYDLEASNNHILTPLNTMSIERARFVRAVSEGGMIPRYSGATYMYDGFVVLVDCNNKKCLLFDPAFKFVCGLKLSSIPWKVTMTGAEEVAVSLPYENKIQFLRIEDEVLSFTRCISTRLPCWGLIAINDKELAVAWDCKGSSPGVGIITVDGEETLFLGKDDIGPEFGPPWQIDFDTGRCRFLVSQPTGTVLSVNLHGEVCFFYRNPKLLNPSGVAVDRDGNVYVCGMKSHNIHQLNSSGENLRLVAMPNLKTPFNISFSRPFDEFLVSTVDNREELQIFRFK